MDGEAAEDTKFAHRASLVTFIHDAFFLTEYYGISSVIGLWRYARITGGYHLVTNSSEIAGYNRGEEVG